MEPSHSQENFLDLTNPRHYSVYAIEPVHFILQNSIPFCEGNVIKYVCRHMNKGGREDLLKAQYYIGLLLDHTSS